MNVNTYMGKYLSKNRKANIKYGLMLSFSRDENEYYLIKVLKKNKKKYLYYSAFIENSALKTKISIEERVSRHDYDDEYDCDDKISYDNIAVDSTEEFYRFSSLKEKLKKL